VTIGPVSEVISDVIDCFDSDVVCWVVVVVAVEGIVMLNIEEYSISEA